MPELPECFVIAPIGQAGTPIRVRSDQILNHILKPVAQECGYKAIRADEIAEAGSITTQVIDHILNDPMVIADLTGNNANVFYELAIRHAIRKPFVQIIQKGEPIPFDVAGIRTIEIDHTNLDSVAFAKQEIKKHISHAAENRTKIESPISVAIDLDKLRQSGDPEKRQLADIRNAVAELKTLIEKRMPAPTDATLLETLRSIEILRNSLGRTREKNLWGLSLDPNREPNQLLYVDPDTIDAKTVARIMHEAISKGSSARRTNPDAATHNDESDKPET